MTHLGRCSSNGCEATIKVRYNTAVQSVTSQYTDTVQHSKGPKFAPPQSVKRSVQAVHPMALSRVCLVPAGILLSPSGATLHV